MIQVDVQVAKRNLSSLLSKVSNGEEIIITRSGKPIARLLAVENPGREIGRDSGLFEVPRGFDDPLPPDELEKFES